jgi:16S rRNA (guanine966-N2)-methyltransferase
MLAELVPGARVLDLYAGSGAVGIEAVSRGARHAVLVEADAAELETSLSRLRLSSEEVRLIASSEERAVEALRASGERFEIVFADPPYTEPVSSADLARWAALLEPGGLLVLQRDAGPEPPAAPEGLARRPSRAYGRNVFHLYGFL